MNPMVFILVILVLGVFVGMGFMIIKTTQDQKRRHMLHVIRGKEFQKNKGPSEKEQQSKRLAEIAKKLKGSREEDLKKAGMDKFTLEDRLAQGGIKISPQQYWIAATILAIFLVLLAKLMGQSPAILILVGLAGLLLLPRMVVKHFIKRRQKQFLEEFPDALESTIRLLRAGMPVSEAISMIAREFSGPVGDEMARIYDKQKIGVALHEAAMDATKRMPIPEMQMFATGLAIQAQTGASLSEVLQNLASVIRARFRLKRKVKALSSEAIASAGIIGVLPILLSLGMYFANQDYIMVLFTDSFGKVLLAGAVIWMCAGIFVMKIMINFKV